MAKQDKTDRRAVVDQIRRKQKGAEKRRGLLVVGVCVVIAVLIIGAAAYRPLKDRFDLARYDSVALDEIGGPADACQKVTTEPSEGEQDHVEPGTPLTYDQSPPAFGQHYNVWDGFDRKMYTASDRPDVGELVHNLEHGFTIVWYDDTVAQDEQQMDELRGIAAKFQGTDNLRKKIKIVPWTGDDGDPFPDDQHVAFTHWSIGGAGNTDTSQHAGVWQYCSEVSGAALDTFMIDYPYLDSPEPNVV